MNKYFCLCGVSFRTKYYADLHAKLYEDLDKDYNLHKIFKMSWKAKIYSFLLECPWKALLRSTGIFILYFIFKHHFNIHFNTLESIFIGFGIGLIA